MRMRFILLSFLLFISCDRRELTYYEVVGVTLMADWSQAGLAETNSLLTCDQQHT